MDIQRIRNLTTRILHTKIEHIYDDLGTITGNTHVTTHMLIRLSKACEPWLRQHVTDPRFWDDKFDVTHTGSLELPTPSESDREDMLRRYASQPSPLEGKRVIAAII